MIPLLIAVLLPLSQAQSAECADKLNSLESSCKDRVITWATKVTNLRNESKKDEADDAFCNDFEKIAECLSPAHTVCQSIGVSKDILDTAKKACSESGDPSEDTSFLETLAKSEPGSGWVKANGTNPQGSEAYSVAVPMSLASLMFLLL